MCFPSGVKNFLIFTFILRRSLRELSPVTIFRFIIGCPIFAEDTAAELIIELSELMLLLDPKLRCQLAHGVLALAKGANDARSIAPATRLEKTLFMVKGGK